MRTLPFLVLLTAGCGGGPPPITDGVGTPEEPAPSDPETPPAPAPEEDATPVGAADFGASLGKGLAGEDGENVFFSPASVQLALGMTLAGARGETAAEMRKALVLPEDPHGALGARFQSWNELEGPAELAVANRVWVGSSLTLDTEYEALITTHYGSGVQPISFGDPEAARTEINGWVSEITRERIPELLAPRVLTPATTMVLTNAIYFLGKWEHAFDPEATQDAPFHLDDGTTTPVPLMSRTGMMSYGEVDENQVVELPYKGGRFRMLAVLPPADTAPADVLAKLDDRGVAALRKALMPSQVRLHLPRFELETSYDLVPPLKALGMEAAFGGGADFSGMGAAGQPISAIVHKAFVAVDEEGTEAAAATAVVMTRSARPSIKQFRADRPFAFVIWDDALDAPLFIGWLAKP